MTQVTSADVTDALKVLHWACIAPVDTLDLSQGDQVPLLRILRTFDIFEQKLIEELPALFKMLTLKERNALSEAFQIEALRRVVIATGNVYAVMGINDVPDSALQ